MRFSNAVVLAATMIGAASTTQAFCPTTPTVRKNASSKHSADFSAPTCSHAQFVLNMAETLSEEETTTLTTNKPSTEFKNEGPFAWMLPYMDVIGFKEGRTLYGAIPMQQQNASMNGGFSEQEAAERRRVAEENLQNIGDEERARRDQIGNIMALVSAVYVSWASLIADDGGWNGHVLRFLLVIPLVFAVGFKKSAQQGL